MRVLAILLAIVCLAASWYFGFCGTEMVIDHSWGLAWPFFVIQFVISALAGVLIYLAFSRS